MPRYSFDGNHPQIDPTAFVHPDATIIGDVHIGPGASIWPGVVLRGDFGSIRIGARSSIQDGSVLHAGPGLPTIVGNECVIGHLVHLEGCTVDDRALVGSGAIVLHRAFISTGAVVGAGSVVTNNTIVAPDTMVLGSPARPVDRPIAEYLIPMSVAEYVHAAEVYPTKMLRLDDNYLGEVPPPVDTSGTGA